MDRVGGGHAGVASMKGFPRRGSDPSVVATVRWFVSLNEGLPQKGKRSGQMVMALIPSIASMKGFPRRGSDDHSVHVTAVPPAASMKGFPRRGSDPDGGAVGVCAGAPQ